MPHSPSLPQHIDSLRSQFKVMKECPLCEAVFESESIKTLGQSPGSHMVHITCSSCKQSLIFLIGMTDVGVGLVGLVSDLTFEDATRLKHGMSMTDDDLLEYYHIINYDSKKIVQLLTR